MASQRSFRLPPEPFVLRYTSADLTTSAEARMKCPLRRTQMKDHIGIESRDGRFNAYIARPKTLPAAAVVVLQELFGVNADIRKHCDELAEQGFVAVAPDLFWCQE